MAKRLRTILEQMTTADARKVFQKHGVTSTDHEELKGHYKRLMKKVHPDHGGSVKDAQELNAAWDKLKGGSTEPVSHPVGKYDAEASHIFGHASGYQNIDHTSSHKILKASGPPSIKLKSVHDHMLNHGYKMGSSTDHSTKGYRIQEYYKSGGHFAWFVHKDSQDRFSEPVHRAAFGKK